MFNPIIFTIAALLPLTAFATDTLTVFRSGDTARAADVNANFKTLWNRINTLALENQGLAKKVDSLQKAIPSKTNLDSVNAKFISIESRLVNLPKGTILASMIEPNLDGFLPNSDQTWLIAAGQPKTNEVQVPDLRGRFLRGINLAAGGKNSLPDSVSDTTRSAGDFQSDMLEMHAHTLYDHHVIQVASGNTYSTRQAFPDKTMTDSTGGTETRPKNVAVYFYIKVK